MTVNKDVWFYLVVAGIGAVVGGAAVGLQDHPWEVVGIARTIFAMIAVILAAKLLSMYRSFMAGLADKENIDTINRAHARALKAELRREHPDSSIAKMADEEVVDTLQQAKIAKEKFIKEMNYPAASCEVSNPQTRKPSWCV